MRAIIGYAALVGLLAIASFACEERPARPTPTTVSGTPVSYEIRGTRRLYHVGDTSQLTAVAVYPNGMRTDAAPLGPEFFLLGSIPAARAVAMVSVSGLVTATAYGRAGAQMWCMGKHAETDITVLPEGMFLLSGRVIEDSLQLPVGQAAVQVVMPGQTFTTVTDEWGHYMLPAAGAGTIRVEAPNFASQSLLLSVAADTQLDVMMTRVGESFGGMYRLTLTATPSCSWPANLATRQYIATVGADPSRPDDGLVALLAGANFSYPAGTLPGFNGGRNRTLVWFDVHSEPWKGLVFLEDLGSGRYLYIKGTFEGFVSGVTFSLKLDGHMGVYGGGLDLECHGEDTWLEFRR